MPRDLRTLPKAHLHLHFTGSMQPATLVELAAAQGRRLPESLVDAVVDGDPVRLPPNERGWFRFQRMYDAARAVVRSEAVMRRLVDEAVAADAAEGSVRLELQVDPTSYAPYVGGLTPALEIVLDAARAAAPPSRDRGRRHRRGLAAAGTPWTPARSPASRCAMRVRTVSSASGSRTNERRGSTTAFAPAFAIAARAGLATMPHGGELLGAEHVEQVLVSLRPDRIGHGVRAAEDPRLLERLGRGGGAGGVPDVERTRSASTPISPSCRCGISSTPVRASRSARTTR